MSTVTESRHPHVREPDAKLRIVATRTTSMHSNGRQLVECVVEIRRGVGEVLSLTITANELLRMVNDSAGIEMWSGAV